MSADTVLARKWRPRQFSEVVGQEPVVRALSQALSSGRLHHAYLFTGTRGVGKTTLARIFAKALNCRQGPTADPCDDDIAKSIDEGRFVDLIEIDAASKTKVEDTRELLDNVQYAPSVGRYKIYLIDEVHMLSNHSFNALLKTLEEPPAHVKFLLATTDPHKLPVTILSRCLQFHLRPMVPEVLTGHLARVLTAEDIPFEDTALALVSKMAQGSVRDALSLLDQAIVLGNGQVGYDSTREMLGLASDAQVMQLLQYLSQADSAGVMQQLQDWVGWGADFDRLQQQVLEQLHQCAMIQSFPALAADVLPELLALAQLVTPEQVQLWLQVALLAQEDMQLAPTAQMGFELMLMRLLHFRPSATHAAVAPVVTRQTQSAAPVMRPAAPAPTFAPSHQAPSVAANVEENVGGLPPHLAALALVGATRKAPEAEKKTVEFAPVVTPTPLPTMVVPTSMPNIDVASMPSEAASVAVSQPSVMISTSKHAQAYSIAAWQDCLSQWRLNPMQLGIADKLVRLVSDDDNKVILACPPHERGALGLLRDKLTQAIERAQPGAKVVWVDDWQDGWLSLATHNQAISQQIQDDAKAHIANNPHFQQTCLVLGLQPNWAQLTPLVTPSTEIPSA